MYNREKKRDQLIRFSVTGAVVTGLAMYSSLPAVYFCAAVIWLFTVMTAFKKTED